MTINEDYLDDIEMNVSDDSKSDIDAAASEEDAQQDQKTCFAPLYLEGFFPEHHQ